MEFPNVFKGDYRLLAIPPLLLILISLFFIPQIKLGVDFRGGTLVSLTLDHPVDATQLKANLAQQGLEDADVRVFQTANGYTAEIELQQSESLLRADELNAKFEGSLPSLTRLEIDSQGDSSKKAEYDQMMVGQWGTAAELFSIAHYSYDRNNITNVNELDRAFVLAYKKVYLDYQDSIVGPIKKSVDYESISVQSVSPALSSHFINTALWVALQSAVLSAIFVFLFFRMVVPSIAVITGAASDILIALGAMGLFGIPFTLPSFAALLMLVGFSLDTDILLSMRVLKRKGDLREKAYDAMKTGLTMSIMAIVAFATLFILAYLTHIRTYYEISAVALAGLVGDMFATWGINGVMILWYSERKEHEEAKGGAA